MIYEIRDGILEVDGAISDPCEDFSSEDRPEPIVSTGTVINAGLTTGLDAGSSSASDELDASRPAKEETRREYNLGVLKYVQAIFGHLALSKLQYYVPKGFWKHFK